MNRFLPVLLFFISFSLQAQSSFRVVGYLPTYRFDNLSSLELERCTHVNIAFVNPNMDGVISASGYDIEPVVQSIHDAGAEAFISLAGGYLAPDVDAAWDFWMQDANRATFINLILDYVQANDIDGVDVDLEWQYVDSYYSPFVLDLKAALQPLGIPLTAALPGSHRYPQITNAALAAFDWVNMMVYDLRGPWDPSNPGQHSPYWWAEDCIGYWQNQGVAPENLTLGMPFYGYNFANLPVTSFTFRYIVSLDTSYAYLDQVDERYYNGIPMIQSKVHLAMDQNLSGVMMWELGQDVLDPDLKHLSLLRAIDAVVNPISNTQNPVFQALNVYPNPATDLLRVDGATMVRVFDLRGGLILESNNTSLDVSGLSPGLYAVQANISGSWQMGRFVKM
ncbi:MAG: glycosyl hydrolase family 18 protein [Saprospiraceae bacterium]